MENHNEIVKNKGKNLYINGFSRKIYIDVFVNALRIKKIPKDETERFVPYMFPLKKIRSIYCQGDIILTSNAINACGNNGIIISFVRAGNTNAIICPANINNYNYSIIEMIEKICVLPNFANELNNWKEEQHRIIKTKAINLINDLQVDASNIFFIERIISNAFEHFIITELQTNRIPLSYIYTTAYHIEFIELFNYINKFTCIEIAAELAAKNKYLRDNIKAHIFLENHSFKITNRVKVQISLLYKFLNNFWWKYKDGLVNCI